MPPIRAMVLALCVMSLLIYSSILMVGDVATSNNLPLNSTLQQNYYILSGNVTALSTTNNTLFKPVFALTQQVSKLQTNLQNGNLIGAGITALELAGSFFGSISAIFQSFAILISLPFAAIGIPTGFALAIGYLMVIVLMALAILTVIFLVPT